MGSQIVLGKEWSLMEKKIEAFTGILYVCGIYDKKR